MSKCLNNLRKQWGKTIRGKGGICGVCGRWGRVYGHKLTPVMARDLVWLMKACDDRAGSLGGDWVDVPHLAPREVLRIHNLSMTRWWGLIMPFSKESGGMREGIWRITKKGRAFALDKQVVPDGVFAYNNTVVGWSDKLIRISDLSGPEFNYREYLKQPVNYRND